MFRRLCGRPGAFLSAAAAILTTATGCTGRENPADLPRKNPDRYRKMVTAFTVAVVALKVCDKNRWSAAAPIPTTIYPDEPAAWANLGLAHTRDMRFDDARKALENALALAPNNAQIQLFQGVLESRQNRRPEAVKALRRAVDLDGTNLYARYALVKELLLTQEPGAQSEALANLQSITSQSPHNLPALVETALLQAQLSDLPGLRKTADLLQESSVNWQPGPKEYLKSLQTSLAAGKVDLGAVRVLDNVLNASPVSQHDRLELQPAESTAFADPIERFIVLANPPDRPAPADDRLDFTSQPADSSASPVSLARDLVLQPELGRDPAEAMHVALRPQSPPITLTATASGVTIGGPPAPQSIAFALAAAGKPVRPHSVLACDWSYDFLPDLVLAGAGGLALYRQEAGRFADATAKAGIPAAALKGPYTGVWAIDLDSDGDLDLVLGAPSGTPVVLQNNGDAAFKPINPFGGVSGVRDFAWADLDGTGIGDAAIIDSRGALHLFENRLAGRYQEWPAPPVKDALAVAAADLNGDGVMDLAILCADGQLRRLTRKPDGAYETEDLAAWPGAPQDGTAAIYAADMDNNGGVDLVCSGSSGSAIFLRQPDGAFKALAPAPDVHSAAPSEPTARGRIDLMGVTSAGLPVRLANNSQRAYRSLVIQPRATYVADKGGPSNTGNARINPFGVGGEVSVRSGLLAQLLPIGGPSVHVGLGDNSVVEALQIIWPDGSTQGEFDRRPRAAPAGPSAQAQAANAPPQKLPPGRPIAAGEPFYSPKRLKGSCPWLFAWNGREMAFVTDILWSSPLGLRINAQGTAGVVSALEWVRVGGDQLAPHDGCYDLRITAELWETHFFDMTRLMTVDHPAGTELYVDERFSIPPLRPSARVFTKPQPAVSARDDEGADVTEWVNARDGRYLDTFGRGRYQGITRDHWVEVELGAGDTLIARGWIHPTDSSINAALSQGEHDAPKSLSLEVPDGRGGWRAARERLGFPAGKNKTMLIDLSGLFRPGEPRRLRLRTNLEVYWDFLGTATNLPNAPIITREQKPNRADLRFRGYSAARSANSSSPEIPDYGIVESQGQRWLDLEGYYTRFGDVRELLASTDDRCVILNAGDEIALRFPEPPPPPAGMARDFVFVSDGWEKDGNFNTGFCRTVLPLPSHANTAYSTPPGRLEDDPVYRAHREDWKRYHTRWISPYPWSRQIWPARTTSRQLHTK